MSQGPTAGGKPEPTSALPLGQPPVAPRTVLLGAVAWLVLAWGAVVASDGLDLFGWQAHLREPLGQVVPQARTHLVLAYGAYGLAAVGSALSGVGEGRHEESVYLGSLYERMGGALEAPIVHHNR